MTPDEKVISDVREYGWHVVKVGGDDEDPTFAFTIGLTRNYGHPELILFGLPFDAMHTVLDMAGAAIKSGGRFEAGATTDELLEDYACTFVTFPRSAYRDHLGYASWFYGDEAFAALQCVWPDRDGRYPWQAGASAGFKALQPVPGGAVS